MIEAVVFHIRQQDKFLIENKEEYVDIPAKTHIPAAKSELRATSMDQSSQLKPVLRENRV